MGAGHAAQAGVDDKIFAIADGVLKEVWLLKLIEEQGGEVGDVSPLRQSFLVRISSCMLIWLCRPIHLLSIQKAGWDMLTRPFLPVLQVHYNPSDQLELSLAD